MVRSEHRREHEGQGPQGGHGGRELALAHPASDRVRRRLWAVGGCSSVHSARGLAKGGVWGGQAVGQGGWGKGGDLRLDRDGGQVV